MNLAGVAGQIGPCLEMSLLPLPVHPLPQAVIFDCDGTLVDTMPAHYRGWEEAFAEHGAAGALDETEYYELGGVPGPGIVAHVNQKLGIQLDVTSVLRLKRAKVQEMLPNIRALHPAASWAQWCHAAGLRLAIGSGGTRAIVLASLEITGLRHLFHDDHVFTADEIPCGKPAPDLFLAAAAALGVAPEDCLVVEDGPPGIAAARAAGMRCLDVRDF